MRDLELNLLKKSFKEYHDLKNQLEELENTKGDILINILDLTDTIDTMIIETKEKIALKEEFYSEFLEFLVNEE